MTQNQKPVIHVEAILSVQYGKVIHLLKPIGTKGKAFLKIIMKHKGYKAPVMRGKEAPRCTIAPEWLDYALENAKLIIDKAPDIGHIEQLYVGQEYNPAPTNDMNDFASLM